jgi:hypothetical protein
MDRDAQLWTVLLVPPFLWATHLLTAYSLNTQICESQTNALLWVVSLVCFGIIGVAAWKAWLLTRLFVVVDPEESRHSQRAKFMALAAFAGSCFFTLLILGQTIPMFILRPCE